MGIAIPLSYLVLIILLADFVEPVSWWPPLVETCHCMQFSGLATRTLSEQGNWFFPHLQYELADLPIDIGLVCCPVGTGQDSVMPDAGKAFG